MAPHIKERERESENAVLVASFPKCVTELQIQQTKNLVMIKYLASVFWIKEFIKELR